MQPNLPGSLATISDLVGFPTAIRVAEMFGGSRVIGLKRIIAGKDHELIDAIGLDAAQAIAREFAEDGLDVPRCAGYWRELRNAGIRDDRESGGTHDELARKYGLTRRQIFNILADKIANECQMSIGFE